MGCLLYTLATITDAIAIQKTFGGIYSFFREAERVALTPEGQRCNTVFSHLTKTWKNKSDRA